MDDEKLKAQGVSAEWLAPVERVGQLACRAGVYDAFYEMPGQYVEVADRIAALVRRDALEEAAKVCEAQSDWHQLTDEQRRFGRGCAAAIRALIPLEAK